MGYETNSPQDPLQRFFTVRAGQVPLSYTDVWKGGLNFHGNRLHSADSAGLSLSRSVCHPWYSEFQGQQCVMDRYWSGVVLGSDILGMYPKCPVGEALRSSDVAQPGSYIGYNRIFLVKPLSGYWEAQRHHVTVGLWPCLAPPIWKAQFFNVYQIIKSQSVSVRHCGETEAALGSSCFYRKRQCQEQDLEVLVSFVPLPHHEELSPLMELGK